MALGAFAALTAEPVRAGVELVSRDLEMAQLRQALTSRIWIEQAKGVLAASQEVTPDEGRGRGRRRRASWPIWLGRCWCRRHDVSGSPP
jgi:hypothetical protein